MHVQLVSRCSLPSLKELVGCVPCESKELSVPIQAYIFYTLQCKYEATSSQGAQGIALRVYHWRCCACARVVKSISMSFVNGRVVLKVGMACSESAPTVATVRSRGTNRLLLRHSKPLQEPSAESGNHRPCHGRLSGGGGSVCRERYVVVHHPENCRGSTKAGGKLRQQTRRQPRCLIKHGGRPAGHDSSGRCAEVSSRHGLCSDGQQAEVRAHRKEGATSRAACCPQTQSERGHLPG